MSPKFVEYEWTLETLNKGEDTNYEFDEVVDSENYDKLSDLKRKPKENEDLGLVRDNYRDMYDRSWAYVKDGVLDEWCRDADGKEVALVPQRYRKEFEEFKKRVGL